MRRSVFRLVRTREYQDCDRGTGSLHSSCSLAFQVLLWRSIYKCASRTSSAAVGCAGCLYSQRQAPTGTQILHSLIDLNESWILHGSPSVTSAIFWEPGLYLSARPGSRINLNVYTHNRKCTDKKLPRLLIGNRAVNASDLADFFQVFVVAVLAIGRRPGLQ